jgi:hypothetical protein
MRFQFRTALLALSVAALFSQATWIGTLGVARAGAPAVLKGHGAKGAKSHAGNPLTEMFTKLDSLLKNCFAGHGKSKGACATPDKGFLDDAPAFKIHDLDMNEIIEPDVPNPPLITPAEPAPDADPFRDDDAAPPLMPPTEARWCPSAGRRPATRANISDLDEPRPLRRVPIDLTPSRIVPAEMPVLEPEKENTYRPVVLQEDYLPVD